MYKLAYIGLSRYAAGIQHCSHAADVQKCSQCTTVQLTYRNAAGCILSSFIVISNSRNSNAANTCKVQCAALAPVGNWGISWIQVGRNIEKMDKLKV